ncbi:putative methyltransferase [Roseovarius sp. A-2]|uniref:class I SAM-dependent methyltransferase n=1 Tax=Roseovarius sp. A-2 TaxID=1570360 RepID=UPI0009D5D6C1|nr:class I SAM-dependent methyltransferase [Roseovarius sp. A-2]GAW34648.1 putative methyltransferase [Roseovarius sp. A-2]
MNTGARIASILKETGARDVLDIGCGHGALARRMVREGLAVTGIDPAPDAIAAAQAKVPEAQFSVAGAEALPFDPDSFDVCVFLNSLHHVPVPLMEQALHEALRVLRPGGEVIVLEPLAEGPFFEVMRPVEDETENRRAAMAAIDAVMASGAATGPAPITWSRPTPVADTEAFIDMLARVDPARRAVAEAQRERLADLFARHATEGPKGPELFQPLCLWRLRPI